MNIINRTKYVDFCCTDEEGTKPNPRRVNTNRKVITRMDRQQEFFQIAEELYGSSVLDMTVLNDEGMLIIQDMVEKTKKAIEQGDETLYNATFAKHDEMFFTILDVLHKESNGYTINKMYTACRAYHPTTLTGLAFDKWLLAKCGVSVEKMNIISSRKLDDGTLKYEVYDVTEEVKPYYLEVEDNIAKMREKEAISQE